MSTRPPDVAKGRESDGSISAELEKYIKAGKISSGGGKVMEKTRAGRSGRTE